MRDQPNVSQIAEVRFYVTEDCNGCGVCKSMAPDFFDFSEYAYYYFLVRQPQNELEISLLRDVAAVCTVDAICETQRTNTHIEEG